MLEFIRQKYLEIAEFTALGFLSILGYLVRNGHLPWSGKQQKLTRIEDMPVTQREFTDGLAGLRTEIAEVAKDAITAKATAQAVSLALENITDILRSSMSEFVDRFEKVADRMDTTVEKMIDQINNHEGRISSNTAIITQVDKRVDKLEDQN